MIRPFTVFCALLAGGSGMFLYTKKHETTVLDQNITRIVESTEHVRQQTAILRTQWALLNQPDRLGALATRLMPQLHPMTPDQYVRIATAMAALPAPGSRAAVADPREALGNQIAPPQAATPAARPAAPAAASPAPSIARAERPAPPHEAATLVAANESVPARAARATMPHAAAGHALLPPRPLHDATHETPRAAIELARLDSRPDIDTPRPARHAPARTRDDATHPPRVAGSPDIALRSANYHAQHPAPVLVAAWRPAAVAPAPREARHGYEESGGSALGGSGGALPPPMPLN